MHFKPSPFSRLVLILVLGTLACSLPSGLLTPRGTPTPTSTLPPLNNPRTPVPTTAAETAQDVLSANIPINDPRALAARLKGIQNIPEVVRDTPPDYSVGDEATFWVSNTDTDEQFEVTAVLRYATPHLYMWVEEGERVDADNLEAAAELFESKTYPTNREFFGSEWTPGVDSDPHLYVLHARNLGETTGGYFSSVDAYSNLVNQYSNEHEMFYINFDAVCDYCFTPVNSDYYNGTLAHEFQHMIHWYNDANEDSWMNEGSSVLAEFLNGYEAGGVDDAFLYRPDTQLNDWEEGTAGDNTEHYGAGYLFMLYFLDRFGEDATRQLIAHDENGIAAVDATLEELGMELTFEDVYADWTVANYLDDTSLADGRYGYGNYEASNPKVEKTYDNLQLGKGVGPVRTTVHQYGTDYIRLRGNNPVTFNFTGSTSVKLIDTDAHSGEYLWWSNRSDDSDTMLTRAIDLSGTDKATLRFWTWYDLEEDWDYAYVEVSADDGATWQILRAPSSTDTNPNGNSFGWGYTGRSGRHDTARWVEEEVDLSDYAGRKILLRFEMITDAAVNRPGMAIDDLRIDEINWSDDMENRDEAWDAQGWVRHNNILLQRYLIQIIERGANDTTVRRLELAADQTGQWDIDLGGAVEEAVLVISALAPKTTEIAPYEYSIAQK